VQRLGKNHGSYRGETIDIASVLHDIEVASQQRGWTREVFYQQNTFKWLALHRAPLSTIKSQQATRVYISAGIHGDEPAGPLAALHLIREDRWPLNLDLRLCPCLNPTGFTLNRRENGNGMDLNRDYRHFRAAEVRAHVGWLERQPTFDISFCLHEDWESHGFYLYELNPEARPSPARLMIEAVSRVCPIDTSPLIEGREANAGLINPNLDPASRPEWPEAFWLLQNKTRQSYTLEAPSDFPLETRVNALIAGINAAVKTIARA
jgi:Succinylglutamate desuccinylase / Aspartoacylase family